MAAEPPKATSSADSYIGSLISLTSKSEIRYEGILYSINTDESSIGLRNVRSFGTEGRKKDGPQVAPSDKVYEYILFRGSDIKDLQVKSSPPVQPVASVSSIDNDPAIIQSHYPRPASTSTNMPPAVSAPSADANSHGPQPGHPGSSFPGALPLYQPGGIGSWGPSPVPGANGNGLAMPMYWPGFYGPPNGLPHMHQQPLLRPPPGLAAPPSLSQPMLFSGFNSPLTAGSSNLAGSKLPEIPPSLISSSSTSTNVAQASISQLNVPSVPSTSLVAETSSSSTVSKAANTGLLSTPSFPTVSQSAISSAPDASIITPAASSKVNTISNPGLLNPSHPQTSSFISSGLSQAEIAKPSLVTPDQLVQSGQLPISSSSTSQTVHKDVEVVQVSSASSSDAKAEVVREAQPPILPLPPPASRAFHKPNGGNFHPRHNYNYRGRDRGRGSGSSRPVTKFTEDFDFMAMNEKFKKDEVWGHLGKSNKSHVGDNDGNGENDFEEGEEESPQLDAKTVYNKDDFFDTLSCNTGDHDSQNGRTRFSEQLKIDAETFGEYVRYHRGGRGGRPPGRGGRGRGSYHGRGYGNVGRGRGRGMSYRSS
ncbi:unnamed protein product [Amaranthus hypochondriacus]